ncbi:GNAT family acetyltransferase [Porticoccaceae bacterium]|nr:GNAT family acetyltransferase [Porticoccaceae bacterium]MDB9999265.1 GNAT family acetyltransferase [Porticoccaceae bacterium]MDC0002756.1 GNAT family acetyltransferase [Porticoccaceae bacterium]
MRVRKFIESDRDTLIRVWDTIFPDSKSYNQPAKVIDSKLAVDDLIFVVEKNAQSNGEIIGACMAGYDGTRGWLYSVGVLPEYRRSGGGRLLVDAALQALKDIGCAKVNLQIRPDNTAVADFYQSLGFEIEDRLSMGCSID